MKVNRKTHLLLTIGLMIVIPIIVFVLYRLTLVVQPYVSIDVFFYTYMAIVFTGFCWSVAGLILVNRKEK